MSARTAAPGTVAPDGRADVVAMGAPLHAQVNLLPPEIRSRRALGRAKVRLAFGLGLVVLLATGAVAWSMLTESAATQRLEDTQARAEDLLAQQAQYAEVPQLKGEILQVQDARRIAMSTEILWTDYLRAIQAVAPAALSITSVNTSGATPMQPAIGSSDPLGATSIGALSFTGRSTTMPDVAAWIDALDSIPGFSDAAFSSATLNDDNGVVFYEIASTVQVTPAAFALRFEEAGQ